MPEPPKHQDSERPTSSRNMTRARLRSTTGCTTCRRRHVKCDELKPICGNCSKKGRACQWLSPTTKETRETRRSRVQTQPRVSEKEVSVWVSEPTAAIETAELNLDANEHTVTVQDEEQFGQSIDFDTANPIGNSESATSPFSATLGSILLDTDINEDVYISRLQPSPAPNRPRGQFDEIHLASAEVLRTGTRAQLAGVEAVVFRNYINSVSLWIDSFSQDQPFHRQVPNLALYCPVLLHSCLALSAKQLNLVGLSASCGLQERDAVHYYRLALNTIRKLLLVNETAQSDEVLAACIVLSTYEMLDVVGDSLGSHLVGVASLLESRQVYGDAGGIRGTCYWTWYRHEIWTALRSGQCLSLDESYWSPPPLDSFDQLSPEDIANRVIFLLGQCVSFYNDGKSRSRMTAAEWFQSRSSRIQYLEKELGDWKKKLPSSMLCFAAEDASTEQMSLGVFGSMSFLFPQSAVANQVYHASRILLHLARAQSESLGDSLARCSFLSLRQNLEKHRSEIFLTANSSLPNAWTLVACQCLYVAGLVTEGAHERQRTLELMDQCQRDSGRKTGYLSLDLRNLWESKGDQ